ncbi:6273_t:CDS:2 [Paraglomus brasilianum]|uniref:6273_t:CDS:1 n=1 Tax=Paraglomus brasilianum TaxID=144538 RepID=A0A9N9C7H3_9GLOM|nr:6273_t:CDS:2 [Paraglomus brasilianum]
MQPEEYIDVSDWFLLDQCLPTNSQNGLQAGPQSRQDQSSLSPLQLPTDMFTSGGLPTYSISQLTSEQQMLTYIGDSILSEYEQFDLTGSIQQPNGAPYPQQNLFMHQQQHQQQWLSQYQYSGQHEGQKPNEVIMPMHELSRQNSIQDMLGVFPIEPSDYAQSQVYPTEIIPRLPPSQQQSNVDQLGNGWKLMSNLRNLK